MAKVKKYGKPSETQAYIQIKIPDGTPQFQLKHVKGMMMVLRNLAKATGKTQGLEESLEPLKQAKRDLEAKIAPKPKPLMDGER